MKTEGIMPRMGHPWSRDFDTNVRCNNKNCICYGYGSCAVPSNCIIDESGCCSWYQKQLLEDKTKRMKEILKEE